MVQRRTEALDVAAPPYTLCCEPACEARVAQDLSRLATGVDSEVGDALRALVLTGPFARGEGGIVEREQEDCAADPGYQLLAIFRRRAERHERSLQMMGATWTRLLRARVSIHALAEDELARAVASRFWHHVGLRQAITLVGDPAIVRKVPAHGPAALRKDEAARALCEALYMLARSALEPSELLAERLSYTQRAVLLCGDAWLLRRGHYAPLLRERARDLQLLHAGAALRAGYSEAILYSERPERWLAAAANPAAFIEATRRWLAAWYLDFEAEYAGTARDALGYARDPRQLLAAWGWPSPAPRAYAKLWPRRNRDPSALERLLRVGVLVGFASHVPACRLDAARVLRAGSADEPSSSNPALARALTALATLALSDPEGDPFASLPPAAPAR